MKQKLSGRLTGLVNGLFSRNAVKDDARYESLLQAYDATLEVWARALEKRKHESEGHIRRVTEMTVELARLMNIPEEQITHVRRGALLHDIGEMYVPETLLLTPEPLADEVRAILHKHSEYAYQILFSVEYLRPALDIPYYHHERWDGNGYPKGLKGEQIPLAARIFSVVDTWDALRANRPYRKAWTDEETWNYIDQQTNLEFDPAVVKLFMKTYRKT